MRFDDRETRHCGRTEMIGQRFHLSPPSALGGYALPAIGVALVAAAIFLRPTVSSSAETAVRIPALSIESADATTASETVVLAGGCFWGVQGVFQHLKGVTEAVSGYAGGTKAKPSYEEVSTGATGHAESVEIKFDPHVLSYGKILQVYFSVAHNPTELDRQGPDSGTQYRSEIFFTTERQKEIATAYIAQLEAAKVFSVPIVTKIEPLRAFYPAEGYHQNYATLHPDQPYIAFNDLPKIDNLSRLFPELYRGAPKLVADAGG
jgi:peptide-methionine (S)-S-oxide reductase